MNLNPSDIAYWEKMDHDFRAVVGEWFAWNAETLRLLPKYQDIRTGYLRMAEAASISSEAFAREWKRSVGPGDHADIAESLREESRRFRKPHRAIDVVLNVCKAEIRFAKQWGAVQSEDELKEFENNEVMRWPSDHSLVVDHGFYAIYIAWRPDTRIIVPDNRPTLLRALALDKSLWRAISPRQFEELVAYLYETLGCRATLTQATRDFGADILAVHSGPLDSELLIAVQVKKYAADHKVGLKGVFELHGAVTHYRADTGHLITTSDFTGPARRFAESNRYHLVGLASLEKELPRLFL